ncbi:MAG: EAL domain-containing protein, partial [Gammaproteobacteria bacterium]
IYADAELPAFCKYIDRWLLRETIGRVVNSENRRHVFVLNISEASLADPSLFNWLRKALTGLDACRPGKYIALEVAAADFMAEKKKTAALMNYLKGSHGFRFVLGDFKTADELKSLTASDGFHLLRMHAELFSQIRVGPAEGVASALQLLKEAGAEIIVDDIKDATALTDAIAGGASYAMGIFIGEPVRTLDQTSNVESFEIA